MMQKNLLALTAAVLVGMSGCAGMQNQEQASAATTAPAEAAKPALSAEAQAALAEATADVKMAKSKNALWTTAEAALKSAEEAAATGDSATVIKQSNIAREHVKLGLGQLAYPQLKIGD